MTSSRNDSPSDSYWRLSTQPLHILVFLLPLIVVYEIGSLVYLHDTTTGVMHTVGAKNLLSRFFDVFGATSLHLPAITLVVVLLLWHVLTRERWRIQPGVLVGMLMEATVLVLPLLVLGLIVYRKIDESHLAAVSPAALGTDGQRLMTPTEALRQFSWQSRLTLSIGAGLYEELVFRLLLITALHLVLADILRLSRGVAAVVACVASAVAFAFYHDVSYAGLRGAADLRKLIFLTIAGVYFGVVFLLRGFGIVVAAHALYDVVVLVVIGSERAAAD